LCCRTVSKLITWGVEFTQHPEMWNAVDIQVPLLDMLRFEKIEAGASWVGEYGSLTVPAERTFLPSISPYNNLKAGGVSRTAHLDDDQRRSRRPRTRA
jgi:prolyl oligopeptidase PreP (S9A serine peptidase family)